MTIKECLELRYYNENPKCIALRELVIDLCQKFIDNGYGDNDAKRKLCSKCDAKYWQQLSEVLLAYQLDKAQIWFAHPKEGPDFLIEHDKRKIWVEVTCPEPKGLPDEWKKHISGVPHEKILLRWTSSINEKAEKLIGNRSKNIKGYLEKNIVNKADAYVIAINGRLLRGFNGVVPQLIGISQLPYAVEATFCVGPFQISFDRQTLRATGSSHEFRELIPKLEGKPVPADTFLDPKFSPISAIWAVDIDENVLAGQSRPMVVVHNPNALNRIPTHFLPAHAEYVATDHGDHYKLDRQDGRLVLQSPD